MKVYVIEQVIDLGNAICEIFLSEEKALATMAILESTYVEGKYRPQYELNEYEVAGVNEVHRSLADRINEYLSAGGLFNPELMDHEKVRDLLIACRNAMESGKDEKMNERLNELFAQSVVEVDSTEIT